MARLRVRLHGKVVQEVQLSEERSYLAGRREDCDISLQNEKGISREHFKISFVEGRWHLEVLSRFGDVISEGEKVQNLDLTEHCIFLLTPYEFEFSEVSGEMVASSRGDSPAIFDSAGSDVSDHGDRTFVGVAMTVPYVKVVDSIGETKEMFKLEGGNTWVAGRESTCDIVIRDPRVSRKQFEIRQQGSQYFITDLGSVNGTLLNGSPVSSSGLTPVKSSDAISVLDNHLYFELHDPNFKARMELVQAAPTSPLVPLSSEPMTPAMHYSQQPQMYIPPGYGPLPETGSKKFDFEKHRIKLIAGAVAFLAVAYFVSGQSDGPTAPAPGAGIASKPQEAFNKLPAEKQILVKQTYQLSKNLYMQGKYELAKGEIAKIYEYVPEYEDSKDLERLANEAIEIQDQKSRQEALEKGRQEAEEKILAQVTVCKGQLNPNYTMEKLEECLSAVLQFNPDHPAIQDLRHEVDQLVALKQTKDIQKQEYQSQVQRLKGLYGRAETSHRKNLYLQAIGEYQSVVSSSLPDPEALKNQARRQIASLQQTLKQKTDQYDKEAEQSYKDQKLKDAILTLRKGLEVDPNNDTSKDKIERYVIELRKQMMVLYQEGVLEESYGNVDGGENRPGAKDKWKKIIDQDIPDGEYYAKAKIKLKKYGAF